MNNNTDTLFNWATSHQMLEDVTYVKPSIIQLGIDRTTGPGNRKPNPYQVCSYLLNFEYINHIMYRSAMVPIREYIAMHYGTEGSKQDDGYPEVCTDEYAGR